ncbi:MAG TPA: hypothetical protein VI913_04805, partial [Candidatus Peribacteraceae bacterium]|nr:hypothetical protein [Candidatus Peribacteraceae bacterium]
GPVGRAVGRRIAGQGVKLVGCKPIRYDHDMEKSSSSTDEFGNVWPAEAPIRADMSAEDFRRMFAGCLTVAVHVEKDEVYAGGPDGKSLEQGLMKKNLDLSTFQLEPGPFPEELKNML